jgi:CLIP-associating protein 1/2
MSVDTNQSSDLAAGTEVLLSRSRESKKNTSSVVVDKRSWTNYPEKTDASLDGETPLSTPRLDFTQLRNPDGHNAISLTTVKNVQDGDLVVNLSSIKTSLHADNGLSIPQLLHQVLMKNPFTLLCFPKSLSSALSLFLTLF